MSHMIGHNCRIYASVVLYTVTVINLLCPLLLLLLLFSFDLF